MVKKIQKGFLYGESKQRDRFDSVCLKCIAPLNSTLHRTFHLEVFWEKQGAGEEKEFRNQQNEGKPQMLSRQGEEQ